LQNHTAELILGDKHGDRLQSNGHDMLSPKFAWGTLQQGLHTGCWAAARLSHCGQQQPQRLCCCACAYRRLFKQQTQLRQAAAIVAVLLLPMLHLARPAAVMQGMAAAAALQPLGIAAVGTLGLGMTALGAVGVRPTCFLLLAVCC
jgi:hypothetical protein